MSPQSDFLWLIDLEFTDPRPSPQCLTPAGSKFHPTRRDWRDDWIATLEGSSHAPVDDEEHVWSFPTSDQSTHLSDLRACFLNSLYGMWASYYPDDCFMNDLSCDSFLSICLSLLSELSFEWLTSVGKTPWLHPDEQIVIPTSEILGEESKQSAV